MVIAILAQGWLRRGSSMQQSTHRTLSEAFLAKPLKFAPETTRLQGRVHGYTLALFAVLAVSPDAMLLRFIRQHAPQFTHAAARDTESRHPAVPTIALIMSI